MLWKIENTPHKILGSIHHLPIGQKLPKWFPQSLDEFDDVVFEADNAKASDYFDRHPGPKPWMEKLVFASAKCRELQLAEGVEEILHSKAVRNRLTVGYLESASRPFELFESAYSSHPDESREALRRLSSDPALVRSEYTRMLTCWLTADRDGFERFLEDQRTREPVTVGLLVTQRNQEWMKVATHMIMSSTPTLFVVGSLHVVGPDSFIDCINSIGYNCRFHPS